MKKFGFPLFKVLRLLSAAKSGKVIDIAPIIIVILKWAATKTENNVDDKVIAEIEAIL